MSLLPELPSIGQVWSEAQFVVRDQHGALVLLGLVALVFTMALVLFAVSLLR